MFNVKRNNVILIMLVFMIAVAVYIDSDARKGTNNLDTDNKVVQVGQNNVKDNDLFTNNEVIPEEPLEGQNELAGDNEQGIIEENDMNQVNGEDADLQGSDPYNFVATIAKVESIENEQIDGNKESGVVNQESKFATQRLD